MNWSCDMRTRNGIPPAGLPETEPLDRDPNRAGIHSDRLKVDTGLSHLVDAAVIGGVSAVELVLRLHSDKAGPRTRDGINDVEVVGQNEDSPI
jgi:hypothetical protein